jgi:hypothetical protein
MTEARDKALAAAKAQGGATPPAPDGAVPAPSPETPAPAPVTPAPAK